MSHRGQIRWPLWLAVATWCLLAAAAGTAEATDAMRTALVVNGRSTDSLTIANHYTEFRSIPDLSIVVLDSVPDKPSCSVDDFREKILRPLITELDRRGLGIQTDVIAYSADFPTAVNLQVDLDKLAERHKIFTAVGAINGLTHLYQFVLSKNPEYVAPLANYYARRDAASLLSNPFRGSDRAVWEEAIAEAEAGDFDTAITKAETLLKKHPHQWPLRYRLAGWLAQHDRHDDALGAIDALITTGVAYRQLFDDERAFDSLAANPQYQERLERMSTTVPSRAPTMVFSARATYGINGLPLGDPAQGMRYLLSTVLAVTHERGTTLPEAIEILRRAATADGTGKPAEFYFSNSKDVRSKTRMPLVPHAAELLRQLGHEVIIDKQRLPQGRQRLMGAMLGSANYDWAAAGNTVHPGGILENLTSTSGALHGSSNSQTPMIELLRGGAAGTSGTVTEPYSLPFKFPTPMLYAYYAQGCSLAEAFYLSVESPYQLLIMGDPLCRPYGDQYTEAFSVELGTEDEQGIEVLLKFWRGPAAAKARLRELEIFFDGRLVSVNPVTDKLTLKKEGLPPGTRELTIAAVSRHPLRLKTMQSVSIGGQASQTPSVQLSIDAEKTPTGSGITARLTAVGASRVALRHLGRRVAEAKAEEPQTTLKLPPSEIGYGPVRLIPEALVGENWVRGTPVKIDVPLPR